MRFSLPLALILVFGCVFNGDGVNPPLDRPYYPTAMAVGNGQLALVSSNYSLRYQKGALISVSLAKLAAQVAEWEQASTPIGERVWTKDAVSSFVAIPSFGESPIVLPSNETLVVSRDENHVLVLGPSSEGQKIVSSHLLTERDPSKMVLLPDFQNKRLAVVAYLSSGRLDVIRYPAGGQIEVVKTYLLDSFVSKTSEDVGKVSLRIQDLVLIEETPGQFKMVVAMQVLRQSDEAFVASVSSAQLLWFDAGQLARNEELTNVKSLDITKETKSRVVAGIDSLKIGANQQIYMITRQPDGILAANLAGDKMTISKTMPACDYPIKIKANQGLSAVYVSCFDSFADGQLVMLDAATLIPKATNHEFGRGPLDLVFDSQTIPGRQLLYVSYFLDGSIGIFNAQDLTPVGRIFAQSARNEPGGQ